VLVERARARKIIRNFGFLTTGTSLGFGCTFLLFVAISRVFGQEGIGKYSFAMALTSYFAAFSDFGLYTYSIKEMSRHTGTPEDYCGGIFMSRLILSAAALTVLLSILLFLPFSHETKLIIALIGAYQVINTLVDGFAAIFVAHEDMHLSSLLELSLRAVCAGRGCSRHGRRESCHHPGCSPRPDVWTIARCVWDDKRRLWPRYSRIIPKCIYLTII